MCEYCGRQQALSEAARKYVKQMERDERKKEAAKRQEEAEARAEATRERTEEDQKINQFKNSALSKFIVVFFVICVLMFFYTLSERQYILVGITLAQVILFAVSWLMGMGIVKEKRANTRALTAAIGFLLILAFMRFTGSKPVVNTSVKYSWPSAGISGEIPKPSSEYGKITLDYDDTFSMDVYKMTPDDFANYLAECENGGFTVDESKSASYFKAYNADGYSLDLSYSESDSDLYISLDAPKAVGTFAWPQSDLASLMPVPASTTGSISWDSSDGFMIYVGDTTKDEYKAYVDECISKGFSVDYQRGDDYFYADNADGDHACVSYEGYKTMSIRVSAPEKK